MEDTDKILVVLAVLILIVGLVIGATIGTDTGREGGELSVALYMCKQMGHDYAVVTGNGESVSVVCYDAVP